MSLVHDDGSVDQIEIFKRFDKIVATDLCVMDGSENLKAAKRETINDDRRPARIYLRGRLIIFYVLQNSRRVRNSRNGKTRLRSTTAVCARQNRKTISRVPENTSPHVSPTRLRPPPRGPGARRNAVPNENGRRDGGHITQ